MQKVKTLILPGYSFKNKEWVDSVVNAFKVKNYRDYSSLLAALEG